MREIVFRITCHAVPVQLEGTWHGRPFYYRARGNRWAVHAIDVNNMPTDPKEALAAYETSVIAEGEGNGGERFDDGTIALGFFRVAEAFERATIEDEREDLGEI